MNKVEDIFPYSPFNTYECLYIDCIDEYVFCERELVDRLIGIMDEREYQSVTYIDVLTTSKTKLSICAEQLLEDACYDLHDDAFDKITSSDIAELQEILDAWCAKMTCTYTYTPDYSLKVSNEYLKHVINKY